MSGSLLLTVAGLLVLALGVQLLARRLQIPSVVFYLALGVILGPELLGIVSLETTFGGIGGLQPIVAIAVAIIVFDGAFALEFERIREAGSVALRLVTIGAVVMFLGMTAAVHYIVGAEWDIALLVGALLVATGPTVVTPILEVVRVREHVASSLETEGIINDVTAAIGAAVIFETIVESKTTGVKIIGTDITLVEAQGLAGTALASVMKLGTGVLVGLVTAGLVYGLIQLEVTPGDEVRTNQFLALAGAVGSYAVASFAFAEAGIAAAATAGIVLGNLDLVHREEIEEFARDITLIVLAFVFVALAALIDIGAILDLGVDALLLALVAMLVLRPALVALSTVGAERFSIRERLFIAGVGPRGIIPASVATLFALEIGAGTEEGQILQATVFAVIFATVAIEAGFARQIGDILGVSPMRTLIVGGGRAGRALAERLENRGEFVVLVEADDEQAEQARSAGFTVHEGDGSEADVLRDAGIGDAKRVIAATGDDDINLLVCQLAETKFDVESIYARVNNQSNTDAFESLDVTAISSPLATAVAIDDEIERPALTHWMNDLGDGHDVQEVEVTSSDFAGKSISEVNTVIPDGCIVAVVGHGDETHVPSSDDVLNRGDSITFVGDVDAVRSAMRRFHPHD